MDWDNKFTDEGQVEIIASRIPTSGGDGHDEIVAPTASWSLANNDQDLVITTTSLSTEDLTKIVTAIDDENLLWWIPYFHPETMVMNALSGIISTSQTTA